MSNMNIKQFLPIATMTLILSTAAFGQAQPGSGTYYTFYGQQTLNAGQSLRLVADNPRFADLEIIPCIRVTLIATFFDVPGDGSVRLHPMRRVTREIELEPGEAGYFDIPAALACDGSVCPQLRNGVSIAVSVFVRPEEGDPTPPVLKFNTTLSMRELGRTVFTLPAVQRGFDPQPDPPSSH